MILPLQRQEKKTDHNLITCKNCFFKFCYRCKEPCYGQWHFNSEYGCPAYSKISQDITYFKALTSENNETENNTKDSTVVDDNTGSQWQCVLFFNHLFLLHKLFTALASLEYWSNSLYTCAEILTYSFPSNALIGTYVYGSGYEMNLVVGMLTSIW